MRTSKSQPPWTLVLSLLIFFLVLPESQTRSVLDLASGAETPVSDDRKDGALVAEPLLDGADSALSERIKTGVQFPGPVDNPQDSLQAEEKGIRRFDAEEPSAELPQKDQTIPKVELSEVKVNVLHDHEDGQRRTVESDEEQRARIETEGEISSDSKIEKENLEPTVIPETEGGALTSRNVVSINSEGLGKFNSESEKDSKQELEAPKLADTPSAKSYDSPIESLKKEAFLLQQQVSDKTLFESVKEPTLVMSEFPLLTELEILKALKSVPSIKDHHILDIEPLGHHVLSDKQTEIIQCSAALMQQQQRPNFFRGMYDCIRGLSVMNCMRIFVYPIIAETVPQLILQNMPSLPIEINVSDLLPSKNKTKTARSGAYLVYTLLNTEDVFIGMLKDVLDTQRSHESVPSYIDSMNETLVKLLSPGQMKILQMGEKILPISSRREYSDRMYSCIRRFEYFSCLRYFAWPMMKLYYPALPDFPEYEILYPIPTFAEYPILPFPLEPLPEVIEADLTKRPDALILRLLREGVRPGLRPALSLSNSTETLKLLEQMIKTLPSASKAVYTRPVALHIPQDQLNSLYVAKQILPPQLRAEFTSQSLKCIREFNYYACMKYYTWPIIRQAQPTLPQFPDLASLFQIPDFSQFFSQFPNLANLFQLPNFQLPTFQLPNFQLPNFQLPEFQLPSFPTFGQPSFPNIPFFPQPQGPPSIPTFPGGPTIPIPEIPGAPALPPIPEAPTVPSIPGAPSIPQFPQVPAAPTIPPIPGVPSIPAIPQAPTVPPIPGVPSIPPIPSIPTIPTAPPAVTPTSTPSVIIRDAQGIQVDSFHLEDSKQSIPELSGHNFPEVEARNSFLDKAIESNITEESAIPSPQKPDIQISSRKNEISNVPLITLTGTEFVPILSEKPETVIFTILRLNQISDPNLMHTLTIPFLNASTPEFDSFLTLHQENIILLAKNMLPESIRSSFSEQMISCVRDKDFLTCSKDVMFPTLKEYFPNIPRFPIFEPPQQPQHQISETNVKTDKRGEATVTITDTRFIPIFSEHPEGVVMNILRAVQISIPNLPAGVLKTREIVNRLEFQKILTEKQIGILEIAETLLPEQLRETFIKRMIECSRDASFLECTRDIAFPSIAQYFPNLPNFPNFGNQLGTSRPLDRNSFQLLRDGLAHHYHETEYLQQIENHLQNEIENILTRAVSVNERSKKTEDGKEESQPESYSLLSKQQKNIMRLSDNILPESVRPAYHARMIDCMQSNSFVSCMQNVGWPILRLNPLLLNSPAAIIPEYTPQASVPIPSPIIIPHAQFNYENLGNLQRSDPGISSDITSSVGRETFAPEIPPYAGQPVVNFVELSRERIYPGREENKETEFKEKMEHSSSRRRRSATDLLDSYPENIPDDRKASVRKNLSKTTFPNITDSELLQILIQIKNSKVDQLRKTPQGSKKYFLDELNEEDRKTLTADQVEILKLVEDLYPEASRGLMGQLWQCIRGFSLIRCAGVFIWPMITNTVPNLVLGSMIGNLPTFGLLGRSETEQQVEELFGISANEFEKNLMERKHEFEDILLNWYKSLMQEKFETSIGFLKIKGHGNGELGISLTGYREGRAKVIKDNKNLPSILTIISDIMEDVLEPKPNPNRNRKDPKRGKSFKFEESNYQSLQDAKEDSKGEIAMKDDRVLAALIEKMKTNDSDTRTDSSEKYFSIQNAYKAFELLFGTRLASQFEKLKSFSEEHLRSFINRNMDEDIPIEDELKIIPYEVKEKFLEDQFKIIPLLNSQTYYSFDDETGKSKEASKEPLKSTNQEKSKKEGLTHRKKHRNELSIELPRLKDIIISKKVTNNVVNMARNIKTKMTQMMPGIGMAVSFLLQVVIAHARTAASVASLMSNIALGMGVFSMIRDTLFGQNPKVKYVYDTETADPAVSWPKDPSYWK
ncbi:uncharacterized protein LOC122500932 [Leptopilina heterotoma]|uniref:uncharacterized protein LOC122500932 n=1 Tax=Leptopilina heterotoma TaxID=63436 RepID=UPI001CA826BF|nr:uncharacterized protein LOC122500932 [Leptopilina heterotoma]